MPAVIADSVTKEFRFPAPLRDKLFRRAGAHTVSALTDVSFAVDDGEALGIIGPNGAGKSTLLRLLAGILHPTSGNIRIKGRVGTLLDLTAGFHPEFSGRDNIQWTARLAGLDDMRIRDLTPGIIDYSELGAFIDEPVKAYSAGMVVRLGFAIAIHIAPHVLIIDEVLAVGDAHFQKKCLATMTQFKQDGAAVVLASHALGHIGAFCEKVMLLEHGRVTALGATDDIVRTYLDHADSTSASSGGAFHVLAGDNVHRTLSKEIEILEVAITDKNGAPVENIASGESLKVSIRYIVHADVSSPLMRVQVYRDDGLLVFGANNARQDVTLPTTPGDEHVATLAFEAVALLAGRYFFTIGFYPDEFARGAAGVAYDEHEMRYPLTVVSDRPQGAGVAAHQVIWTIQR